MRDPGRHGMNKGNSEERGTLIRVQDSLFVESVICWAGKMWLELCSFGCWKRGVFMRKVGGNGDDIEWNMMVCIDSHGIVRKRKILVTLLFIR